MAAHLIAACATHIGSHKDLRLLDAMVKSWALQVLPCELFLSVSVDEDKPDVRALCTAWCSEAARAHPTLVLALQPGRMSQLQHYRYIALDLAKHIRNDACVIFSDADDLWHHERTFWYMTTWMDAHRRGIRPGSVWARSAMFYDASKEGNEGQSAFMPTREIDALLAATPESVTIDDLKFLTATDAPRPVAKLATVHEYFTRGVALGRLRAFFRVCPPAVLTLLFGDMYLRHFLEAQKPHAILSVGPEWLYAYRRRHNSATFEATDKHMALLSDADRDALRTIVRDVAGPDIEFTAAASTLLQCTVLAYAQGVTISQALERQTQWPTPWMKALVSAARPVLESALAPYQWSHMSAAPVASAAPVPTTTVAPTIAAAPMDHLPEALTASGDEP